MNYNDVVNRIQTIVQDHKMLVDFGYGQISDIKTRSEGAGEAEGADYPYLFLNPQTHLREESTITYNFNMIVMDMAREEEGHNYQNFLNIQSDAIQYIDDVLARLYYYYRDKPQVSFDTNYTVFYERFQDDLAGATAVLTITVPNNINECIAPFTVPVPPVIGLTHGQPTLRQLNNTAAAFGADDQTYDNQYFADGSYSTFNCTSVEDFDCTFNFTGNFTYTDIYPFNPLDWQLAIVKSSTGEFIGMTDLPATGGPVDITSDTFTFPAGVGSYYFTLFERGTANPDTNPSFINQPLEFDGTFIITIPQD